MSQLRAKMVPTSALGEKEIYVRFPAGQSLPSLGLLGPQKKEAFRKYIS
jgi:hypothetical protein